MITEITKNYNHLTLSEIKKHLHINEAYTDDDSYLTGLIAVATDIVENDAEINIAEASKSYSKTLESTDKVEVEDSNLDEITAITIDGTALQSSDYTLTKEEFRFKIEFEEDITGELVIEYNVGFTSSTIKPVLKQCILIKIFGLYDNERAEYSSGNYSLNKAYTSMLNYYKRIVFI